MKRTTALFFVVNSFCFSFAASGEDLICPPSWKEFDGSCYRLIKESVDRGQAEQTCQAWKHGHLVSIASLEEQHFVQSLVVEEGVRTLVWIGLKKEKFEWVDGKGLDYAYWQSNQPNDYTSTGAHTYMSKGHNWRWYDVSGTNTDKYVSLCKMPKPASGDCPDASYWSWSDYCYRLQPVLVSFEESEALCASQGSYLANVHSASEMTYLRNQLSRHSSNSVWIGLKLKEQPFEFSWSDNCTNATAFTHWRYGPSTPNPDVSTVGSVCVRLDNSQNWRWAVVGCNKGAKSFYICESAMIPKDTEVMSCASQNEIIFPANQSADSAITTVEKDQCSITGFVVPIIIAIFAVEIVLIVLVLALIWCFRNRNALTRRRLFSLSVPKLHFRTLCGKKIIDGKGTVVFKRNEEEPEHPFLKLKHQKQKSPGGADKRPTPADRKPGAQSNGVAPRTNDYTKYKLPSVEYENNLSTTKQDEELGGEYQEVDDYEELPLSSSPGGYEQPT